MLILEGSLLVWLQSQKHLIPFCKLTFRATLICLLLHAILCHDQVLFKGTRNILSNYKCLVNCLDLQGTR
jgi:hypothetical protein